MPKLEGDETTTEGAEETTGEEAVETEGAEEGSEEGEGEKGEGAEEGAEEGKKDEGEDGEEAEAGAETFDYTGMIDDNDMLEMGGKKVKFGEAKKLIESASKNKELLDAIEKDPAMKEQLLKGASDPKNAQIKEGQKLTPEQAIMVQILKREYNREWEKVSSKYDLVEREELFARMHMLPAEQQSPDNVEKIASNMQKFYEKKLEQKEKIRIERKKKAVDTNFETGGGPSPAKKSEGSEDIDLENIDSISASVKNYRA